MSLDGFIAGLEDDVRRFFDWYFSGDTDFEVPGNEMVLRTSRASAELIQDSYRTTGAVVFSRSRLSALS